MLFNKLLKNIQKYFIGVTLCNGTMFLFPKTTSYQKKAIDRISLSSQWSCLAPKRPTKNTDFYH